MLSTKLSHVTSPHALKGQMGRPHTPERADGKTPHALKGQKLLAQGNALGNYGRKPVAL